MLSLLIVKGPSAWTERIRAKRNKHSWCSKQNTKPFFFFFNLYFFNPVFCKEAGILLFSFHCTGVFDTVEIYALPEQVCL